MVKTPEDIKASNLKVANEISKGKGLEGFNPAAITVLANKKDFDISVFEEEYKKLSQIESIQNAFERAQFGGQTHGGYNFLHLPVYL